MTAIPPTLPPAPPTTAPPAPVTASVVSPLPATIASLPPSSVIEATVVAAPVRAVVQVMTALGPITLRLPISLPPNATLRLQVAGGAVTPQFRVLTVNGQPLMPNLATTLGEAPVAATLTGTGLPAEPAAPTVAGPSAGSVGALGAAADEAVPAPAAGGIGATVVLGTRPEMPTGTALTLRILSVAPPAPGASASGGALADTEALAPSPTGLPSAMRGAIPTPGDRPSPSPTVLADGAQSAAPEAPIGAGATGASRTPALGAPPGGDPALAASNGDPTATPPGAPTSPSTLGPGASTPTPTTLPPLGTGPQVPVPVSAPLPAPTTLDGVVAPNSLAGKTLVQTPAGLISLNQATDLQPGARLVMETVGPPIPPAAPDHAGAAAPGSGWATLDQTVAALQRADPAAAQLLAQRLPDLGPQFVVNIAGWVAATQSGDMRAWLGERPVKALEKAGRADLIERLDDEIDGMRAPTSLPSAGGAWQTLTLPLFLGQRIERLRLTVRRRAEDEDADEREEEGFRFLLDIDMSRLGALQLDGLVKRKAKRFDLIVRSRMALTDEVRRDIGAIFTRALDGLGMTGGAVFKQAVAFVEPIPVGGASGAGLTI